MNQINNGLLLLSAVSLVLLFAWTYDKWISKWIARKVGGVDLKHFPSAFTPFPGLPKKINGFTKVEGKVYSTKTYLLRHIQHEEKREVTFTTSPHGNTVAVFCGEKLVSVGYVPATGRVFLTLMLNRKSTIFHRSTQLASPWPESLDVLLLDFILEIWDLAVEEQSQTWKNQPVWERMIGTAIAGLITLNRQTL